MEEVAVWDAVLEEVLLLRDLVKWGGQTSTWREGRQYYGQK